MERTYLAFLSLLLCACVILNPGVPTPKAMQLHEYPDSLIKISLVASDGVAAGTVVKVDNNWDYDVSCHFPTQFMGCKNQNAFEITLEKLHGGKDYLWGFPPRGQYLPVAEGMQAIFLYQSIWIIPVDKCEHMGQFTQACLQTQGVLAKVVTDTLDIIPLSDTTKVDSLRKVIHR